MSLTKKLPPDTVKGYRMLEPDALKGACPVLRRERTSNRSFLFNR